MQQNSVDLSSIYLIFFIFGQTPSWPAETRNKQTLSRICSIALKIVYLLVLISLIYWMTTSSIKSNELHEFTSVLARVPFLFYILSNLVAVFSEWTNPNISQWLYKHISHVLLYTMQHVSSNLSLNQFKTGFYGKVLVAMLEATISFIVQSQLKSVIIEPVTEFLLLTATIYRYAAIFHILLFVDLIAYVMLTMNMRLDSINEQPLNPNEITATLQHFKWIHYNLYRASNMLNER